MTAPLILAIAVAAAFLLLLAVGFTCDVVRAVRRHRAER